VLKTPPRKSVEELARIDAARLGGDAHDADALLAQGPHALLARSFGRDDEDGRFAELAASLDRALEEHFDPEQRAFTPHLTLARLVPPRNLREFVPDLVGTNVASERFAAAALVLYRSHLSPAGARYEPLLVAPFGRDA